MGEDKMMNKKIKQLKLRIKIYRTTSALFLLLIPIEVLISGFQLISLAFVLVCLLGYSMFDKLSGMMERELMFNFIVDIHKKLSDKEQKCQKKK